MWGTVIGVRKNEMLQVSGHVDAAFGGPAGLFSTWRLAPKGKGTLLTFQETTWGAASRATRDSLDAGWKFLFDDCLRPWIERGSKSPTG